MRTNDLEQAIRALDSGHATMLWLIRRRFRRRMLFLLHAGAYFSLTICYTGSFYQWYTGAAMGALAAWGMLLVTHMAWVLLAGARDRAILREVEWARAQANRQVKRDTNADELVDLEEALAAKRKRR